MGETWRGNTNGGAAMAVSDPLCSILVFANRSSHLELSVMYFQRGAENAMADYLISLIVYISEPYFTLQFAISTSLLIAGI
ncbi:hypothetical protein QVD17_03186 [Tagetes erecta]|uniref:Uncharacterized protein n=1 Tax=Tagetes erecta TaxID=13708 RepID=A0AAD8LH25_TARER|nr:hypothetical protein QVD17_03186 [Tagetes erecta]